MNDEGKLTIVNENNEQKDFSILATFEAKDKNFVIYTDYSINENGNIRVYSSIYHPDDPENKLDEVVEEDEIQLVEDYVEKLANSLK